MAKQAIKLRETDGFVNGQGAKHQAEKSRKAASAARRASYEGETFTGMTPAQKDALLRDIAIELGLISE